MACQAVKQQNPPLFHGTGIRLHLVSHRVAEEVVLFDQGNLQHLVDMIHKNDFHRVLNIAGHFRKVFLIVLGNKDHFDIAAVSRQNLFLQAADRQDPSPQRNFRP
jgi:hypothetical protein